MVDSQFYEIHLRGRLDASWSEYFMGMQVSSGSSGETVLRGALPDQAALYGVLMRIRDLGHVLIYVKPCEGPVLSEAKDQEPSHG